MACGLQKWSTIFTILVILSMKPLVHSEPQVPCYFIMGDSIVDNGNNNVLDTMAKANHPPYGVDFHDGPTGRFTNGRNIADFVAELLGFNTSIPPFATAQGQEIIRGVNYGSGGAGIRNETGQQLGNVTCLNRQLSNHQTTMSRIAKLQESENAAEHLSKCLYTVGMGSNDYINNYFMPEHYLTKGSYAPDQYATLLIQDYSKQLRNLYNFGARKVAVFGLGLIGCTPAMIEKFGTKGSPCVDEVNNAVHLFNDELKPLIDDLNKSFKDAQFIYINITSISSGDPSTFGIKVANAPCCKVLTTDAEGQCVPDQVPCSNRTDHAFFDDFHPTEIVNQITASRAYKALSPTDAYPFDIKHLVQA